MFFQKYKFQIIWGKTLFMNFETIDIESNQNLSTWRAKLKAHNDASNNGQIWYYVLQLMAYDFRFWKLNALIHEIFIVCPVYQIVLPNYTAARSKLKNFIFYYKMSWLMDTKFSICEILENIIIIDTFKMQNSNRAK